jgi:lysyl-tRNA synthetase, class II
MDYLKDFSESTEESRNYTLDGRVVAKRDLGKIVFLTLKDQTGSAQIAFQSETLGSEFSKYKSINVGDLIQVEGTSFISRNGTRTLDTSDGYVVAPCSVPFPDKHNGLSVRGGRDNRGLELATSEEAITLFRRRNDVVRQTRTFLYDRGFQEVDTGILQPVTNTSLSSDFRTHSEYFDRDLFLRKTPELRLKQLLVGGLRDIFEMGKNFRNEGVSKQYHPEYTILELYQNGATYKDVLRLTVDLLGRLNTAIHMPSTNPTSARDVFLYDFINSETGVNPKEAKIEELKSVIDPEILKEYPGASDDVRGFYVYDVFRTLLKQHSDENLILHGVPKEISVLGKAFDDEPSLIEEFRYFVHGNLICNGITELNDAEEQRKRIVQQARTLGKTLDKNDDQFLDLLKFGLPPCAGIGLGLEKMLMVYLETDDVRDVIYYPL